MHCSNQKNSQEYLLLLLPMADQRYTQRGVSADKEDVHHAIRIF